MLPALIGPIIGLFGKVIDQAVEDPNERNRLKAEAAMRVQALAQTELKGAIDIVLAEAKGQSWLQRNWRPLLMMTVVIIIANNFLFGPYVEALFSVSIVLPLPPELYDLMKIGVGGYVVGRSAEKIAPQIGGLMGRPSQDR